MYGSIHNGGQRRTPFAAVSPANLLDFRDTSPAHPVIQYSVEAYDSLYSGGPKGDGSAAADAGGREGSQGSLGSLVWRQQNDEEDDEPTRPLLREIENHVPRDLNIGFDELQVWRLASTELFRDVDQPRTVEGRQEGERTRRVFITFNTCLQPQSNSSSDSETPLPQLELYISNSTANQTPGPNVRNRPQISVIIRGGFGALTLDASSDIFIGVYGPGLPDKSDQRRFAGDWNYQISLSTKAPYHNYEEKQNLFLIDSDNTAALLITNNMTKNSKPTEEEILKIMSTPPPFPFDIYATNRDIPTPFDGLERSYCAVTMRRIAGVSVVNSLTRRGLGNLPKQQFHITGLNKSATYNGYLARPRQILEGEPNPDSPSPGRPTTPNGGTLWKPIRISTKSDGNCQVVYDLSFCSEVAYAVPSNPTLFNSLQLREMYDGYTKEIFQNFTYSLQQIPCNASSEARYSLTRSCDDCYNAYKTWLCAVSIPRCADYSSDLPYLASRGSNTLFFNATSNSTSPPPPNLKLPADPNSSEFRASVASRNPIIESQIRPGPYKEIKPCLDLCYTMVQSCPSDFNFVCPRIVTWGQEVSYGERSQDGDITCSFLGAAYFLSNGRRLRVNGGGYMWWWWALVVVGTWMVR